MDLINVVLIILAIYISINLIEKIIEHQAFKKWGDVPYLDKNRTYYMYHILTATVVLLLILLLFAIR